MHFKKTILKNGLRLVTAPMKDTNTVTVIVAVAAGSKYESKKTNGLSHFLEHLFFKGTKKRPKTKDIAEALDSVGGEYNAFTSQESTAYFAKVDQKHLDLALDVVSDIYLNSKLDRKEIEKERGVITQEINMYEDTPMLAVQEEFEELLYGDQPAGWKVIGTKENILRLKRQDFADYMQKLYTAPNTVVTVAGNFNEKKIKSKIARYFSGIRKGKVNEKAKTLERQNKPALKVRDKKTDQAHLVIGFRSFDMFHPDRYALSLLANILGGTMSSRLFLSVREREGLAYYINASSDNYSDCGYFSIRAGVDTDPRKVEKTIRVILREIAKIRKSGVTPAELKKAKDNVRGKTALSLESSDEVAMFLAGQELSRRKIETPEEILSEVDRVSQRDIRRVTKNIFRNEKMNLAAIGPFQNKKFLEKIFRL